MQNARETLTAAAQLRLAEFFGIDDILENDETIPETGASDFLATMGFSFAEAINPESENYLLDDLVDVYALKAAFPLTDPVWDAAITQVTSQKIIQYLEYKLSEKVATPLETEESDKYN